MDAKDIQRVMDQVPGLNDFGIGVYDQRRKSAAEQEKEMAEGRATLLRSVDACNKICIWLSQVEKIKTPSGRSSYGLKDLAENDIGYITNGAFIAAAVHCGYPYRITPGSANVAFGMSEKSIKAIMRRQNKEGRGNWAV